MAKTLLGKTELNVGRLGFGAAPIGFLETPQQQVDKLIGMLLDEGVNLIDTAAMYRDAEALLGQALKNTFAGHRDDLVLVSKCGTKDDGLPGQAWSADLIHASIDRSLKRLGTDHLDVILLHSCPLEVLEQGEAIGALLDAVKQGKARHVGYSGDNAAAAAAAQMDEVEVLELSINICDQANIRSVLPHCIQNDKGVIAKRPIANAAWNPLNKQRGMYQEYARVYHDRLKQMKVKPDELGYSGHPEVEWPEIALKFTLAIEGVHAAIVGTTSTVNAHANLDAVKKNPLREQVVLKIKEAFNKAESRSQGPWDGQT
ncbi:MAG: aldo/keto reductase [Planctomycetota bacterium]